MQLVAALQTLWLESICREARVCRVHPSGSSSVIFRPLSLFKARRRLGLLRAERMYSEMHQWIIMSNEIINNMPLSELSEGAHIHLAAFIQISWSLWNILIHVGWKVLKFTLYGNRSGKGEENEDRSFNNYNNNIFGLTVSFSMYCIHIIFVCTAMVLCSSIFSFCSISLEV